jgi:hypothetical protein
MKEHREQMLAKLIENEKRKQQSRRYRENYSFDAHQDQLQALRLLTSAESEQPSLKKHHSRSLTTSITRTLQKKAAVGIDINQKQVS